jgi:hypothetical protein
MLAQPADSAAKKIASHTGWIFSPSAAPTAPLGLLFLTSPEFYQFRLGLNLVI